MSQQQVFSDRYELVRHIARGGMAQVYLAKDILLDRPVALKVLFPELSTDQSFVQRFRAEAKAAANLSHPNIVAVYDWGQGERTYFIVMEFIDGSTLSQQIRQAPLDPNRAAVIGADVAAALEFAHRRGVIHRDVKPGNVLIDQAGQVKVADFGIARAVGAAENLTQTGAVMGTATYFSPEQAQGLTVDARSDVYSLGVVLYEMVAGRAPFTGDNPVTIAYKHVREEPPSLAQARPGLPPAYEAIVMKAMAKDPAARYQTAGELRADLLRFAQGQAVTAGDYAPTVVGGAVGAAATRVQPAADSTRVVPVPGPGDRRAAALAAAEEDTERSRTALFVGLLVALLVVLGVLLFFLGRQVGWWSSSSGTTKIIPNDIIGKPVAAAQSELSGLGFTKITQTGAKSDSVNQGLVISSSPAAGTSTSTTTPIVLTYSTGPTSVQIPNVTNQTQDAATTTLRAAGFQVTVGPSQNSSTIPAGIVISTNPAAGQQAPKGSSVQLILSSGQKQVQIPALAGQDSVTASNTLGKLGFNVTQANEASTKYPAGQVTRTDPPAGSSEPFGSQVTLYVSTGAQVPNVVGLSQSAAQQKLAAAGLTATPTNAPTADPSQVGVVTSQNPAGGTQVAPGSAVAIVIGTAEPSTTTTSTTMPPSTTSTPSTTAST
ncbi:Stk1 family PASTA domain-containing Ser/Thr kinase [Acidiferrimicrobium sp. IK]|uniref:Stk1 family PASTA domain-containing Ser/Thr kinase n=1 Tax=Acidiferrimicrobium sp. IK TaxID=2871700 RepID=UPI0021CB6B21|nr:Stk1 family PASTA domain-containing Ser/Thr kinase [Acidiferrimicrobium sp. IK]MCU4186120.1 Stk1 family PASTA domain-containing Ser/Thr kinase [Acidiferrimicrobium sp. IK]